MQPKLEKPVDLVEIASDDDDNVTPTAAAARATTTTTTTTTTTSQSSRPPQEYQTTPQSKPPVPVDKTTDVASRSFWKAGNFAVASTNKLAFVPAILEHARVHPKFLHSNATSHKWAFGAIAELLDNSVDEIQNGATFVKVDKIDIMKDKSPALLFQDDGGGMDPGSLRKCMSLGYSTKKTNKTIGQYGNGFKTSTMRLGADAIVFSRATSKATQSVGLLSYTFLRKTGQDDVIVPMIDYDISGHWAEPIIYGSQDDWTFNLKTILEWSPFASKDELMQQFEDIGPHGTKVIIYNLWLNDEGVYELSFDDYDEDIRLRDEANSGNMTILRKKLLELQSHISYRIRFSLRDYVSLLYLRKFENFQIILRGKPVQQFDITDVLMYRKVMSYRPTGLKRVAVETTVGFIKKALAGSISGVNVYHKNRLIKPFWKVVGDGSAKGNGVVGVLEVNFIEPTHDKQDFERSSLFVRMESRLKHMIYEYWKGHRHLIGDQLPGSSAHDTQKGGHAQPSVGNATNMHKQLPANHHNAGRSSHIQKEMHLGQAVVGLQANVRQDLRNEQPAIQPTIDLTDGLGHEVTSEGDPMSLSVDQICEENIKLFMRCEEEMKKENELKCTVSIIRNTSLSLRSPSTKNFVNLKCLILNFCFVTGLEQIEELEKELEQMKRKCKQLSVHLETRKKQNSSDEQMETVS
ncbi:hypothetical protein Dsin_011263 [Dipteronia sinensis]|uniref:Morc S5 domain-containing protein n=1 Tax=Dipteronia sinensis TaxID=43782 RepID=A0AAE0AUT4_9ROSI|nr:hypothetical protein Dsin_011263 [Dipteronia sinensis]